MPFAAGTFTLVAGNPVTTGTTISSVWANNTLSDLATGLSTCLLKDGSQTVTANIPMAGFKLTGLGAGSTAGDSVRYEQVVGVVTTAGDIIYASGAGAFTRLGMGTVGQHLSTASGAAAPEWISDLPQNSQSTAYTTVAADAGKHILHPTADNNPRTFTIDSNTNVPYPIGTTITFVNQINTLTIAITTDTLTLAGAGLTGSRTLAANGVATALKVATTAWVINGTGIS